MAPGDWALLAPLLQPVDLPQHATVQRPGAPAGHVLFPEDGIVSIVATLEGGRRIEAGLYGLEGFSGVSAVLGAQHSPHEHVTQVAAHGLQIETPRLLGLLGEAAGVRGVLLRFAHTLMIQVAETAAANGLHQIEQRLCRWLLMCHDRLEGDVVSVTHESLGVMLGVRRSSVTMTLHRLEEEKLIAGRRGQIVILDRQRLEAAAGEGYGRPEAEYRRLLGEPFGRD